MTFTHYATQNSIHHVDEGSQIQAPTDAPLRPKQVHLNLKVVGKANTAVVEHLRQAIGVVHDEEGTFKAKECCADRSEDLVCE